MRREKIRDQCNSKYETDHYSSKKQHIYNSSPLSRNKTFLMLNSSWYSVALIIE